MFELDPRLSGSYWMKESLLSQLEPPTKMALHNLHRLGKWQKKWPQEASSRCPFPRWLILPR